MSTLRYCSVTLALALCLTASSTTSCSTSASSRVERTCDPGSSKSCICDTGEPGTHVCLDAGAYGACSCSPGTGGSSATGGSGGTVGTGGTGGGTAGTGGTAGDASTDGGGTSCVLQMVAGSYDTCARKADGTVWCWGGGNPSPAKIDLTDVVELTSGTFHKCARKRDGSVWCWGANSAGQLGDGTNVNKPDPVQLTLPSGPSIFIQITAGGFSSCARATGGMPWCWGSNNAGQTGDGTTQEPRYSPVPATNVDGNSIAEIIAVGGHTCARMTNGSLRCWGDNADGQLGDGTTDPGPKLASVEVAVLGNSVVRSSGRCAIKNDLTLFCWGINSSGQVGDGTTDTRTSPVQLTALGNDVAEVTRTFAHTCARKQDGSAWCWGRSSDGSLGDGTLGGQPCPNGVCKPDPVRVSGLTGAVAITAGISHSCAAKDDGTTWCWGANGQGQLGDGTNTGETCGQASCRSSPVQTLLSCP